MTTFKQAGQNLAELVIDKPANILVYMFLYINIVYGVAFTFFAHTDVIQSGGFALAHLPPELWGLACFVLVLATIYSIAYQSTNTATFVGYLGVGLWGYALTLYAVVGLWFGAFTIYLPQFIFWLLWGIAVQKYRQHKDIWGNPLTD